MSDIPSTSTQINSDTSTREILHILQAVQDGTLPADLQAQLIQALSSSASASTSNIINNQSFLSLPSPSLPSSALSGVSGPLNLEGLGLSSIPNTASSAPTFPLSLLEGEIYRPLPTRSGRIPNPPDPQTLLDTAILENYFHSLSWTGGIVDPSEAGPVFLGDEGFGDFGASKEAEEDDPDWVPGGEGVGEDEENWWEGMLTNGEGDEGGADEDGIVVDDLLAEIRGEQIDFERFMQDRAHSNREGNEQNAEEYLQPRDQEEGEGEGEEEGEEEEEAEEEVEGEEIIEEEDEEFFIKSEDSDSLSHYSTSPSVPPSPPPAQDVKPSRPIPKSVSKSIKSLPTQNAKGTYGAFRLKPPMSEDSKKPKRRSKEEMEELRKKGEAPPIRGKSGGEKGKTRGRKAQTNPGWGYVFITVFFNIYPQFTPRFIVIPHPQSISAQSLNASTNESTASNTTSLQQPQPTSALSTPQQGRQKNITFKTFEINRSPRVLPPPSRRSRRISGLRVEGEDDGERVVEVVMLDEEEVGGDKGEEEIESSQKGTVSEIPSKPTPAPTLTGESYSDTNDSTSPNLGPTSSASSNIEKEYETPSAIPINPQPSSLQFSSLPQNTVLEAFEPLSSSLVSTIKKNSPSPTKPTRTENFIINSPHSDTQQPINQDKTLDTSNSGVDTSRTTSVFTSPAVDQLKPGEDNNYRAFAESVISIYEETDGDEKAMRKRLGELIRKTFPTRSENISLPVMGRKRAASNEGIQKEESHSPTKKFKET